MAAKKHPVHALTLLVRVPAKGAAQSVDLMPDGSGVLLGGFAGLWVVDIPSGTERYRLRNATGVVLWNARVSKDGKRIVGAFGDLTMHVWDTATRKVTSSFATHNEIATRISLSIDGSRALTVARNNRVTLWDIEKGEELAGFALKKSFAIAGALSPDGRHGVYGGTDGVVRVHDFETNAERWSSPGNGWIQDIDVSSDGRYFVSGGRGKAVLIWDAATGARVRSLHIGANVTAVGISPDGRFATALAGRRSPPVWDTGTGALVGCLDGHDGNVSAVRFGHDSASIATTDDRGAVRVFGLPV